MHQPLRARTAAGFTVATLSLFALAAAAAAQSVPVKLTLVVAGASQTLRGTGQCRHEPQASIYGTRAQLWMAEFAEGEGPRVTLTFWQPRSAGAASQFQLQITRRGRTHRINTVQGSTPAGSGTAEFRPTALGGRFIISGTAQDGAALQATIECARFGGIVAEGG